MKFTDAELAELDIALMHLRRHYDQLAIDFRREPARDDIAQEYEAKAKQAAALRNKIRAERQR